MMYNIKDLGQKRSPAIRLKIVVQTKRRTESISECTLQGWQQKTHKKTNPKHKKPWVSCFF